MRWIDVVILSIITGHQECTLARNNNASCLTPYLSWIFVSSFPDTPVMKAIIKINNRGTFQAADNRSYPFAIRGIVTLSEIDALHTRVQGMDSLSYQTTNRMSCGFHRSTPIILIKWCPNSLRFWVWELRLKVWQHTKFNMWASASRLSILLMLRQKMVCHKILNGKHWKSGRYNNDANW